MERNHTGIITTAWHPPSGQDGALLAAATSRAPRVVPASHLDLAQLLLDLAGHLLGPVVLPEEIPEDAPHQCVHPGRAPLAAPGCVLAELRVGRSHERLEQGGTCRAVLPSTTARPPKPWCQEGGGEQQGQEAAALRAGSAPLTFPGVGLLSTL